ncbi:BTAD domain-containing putative transcriptional regulator [Euzebya tangerina]|uniref:BTAD domain-containing putative transcriptional regulator n=1 Tax=Euzebya tangerina TaxID=591198 RepID=UPI000E3151C0|nr:BTAD domain-containing putative transcriptional regulator [Euzebya tangerina]
MPSPSLHVIMFGTLRLERSTGDDRAIALTLGERRVLGTLALHHGTPVPEARLTDALWPDGDPPATARNSLHNHLSRLRAKIGRAVFIRGPEGYRLASHVSTDLEQFTAELEDARQARTHGLWAAALEAANRGTAIGVGPALPDLDDTVARGVAARLDAEVDELLDLRTLALLELGQLDPAISQLRGLLEATPTHERRWELLMVALDRAGRRTEALDAFHSARRKLVEEHGTEPGPELSRLHAEMLRSSGPTGDVGGSLRIGRTQEVEDALAAISSGKQVAVTGPAGIGKTSLLRMIRGGWKGRCITVECNTNPWRALGPVHELMDHLRPTLLSLGLPADPTESHDVQADPARGRLRRPGSMATRTASAIATALVRLPDTVVLIDNIDRAGPTTRSILVAALRESGTPAVFAARDGGKDAAAMQDAVHIPLAGLDSDALADLVGASRPDITTEDVEAVAQWLRHRTGGHPLYARQLLEHTAAEEMVAGPGEDHGQDPLDAGLVALLQARLAELPSHTRPLLDATAVMADPLDLTVLRAITDVGRMDPLIAAGVLVEVAPGEIRFSHELFRRVARDQIPPGRRLELHHAIGQATTSPPERAHHLVRAAELDPHAAVSAAGSAAREAFTRQAYADAAEWFRTAAQLAESHQYDRLAVLDLQLEAADSARLAGESGHATSLLDLAEEAMETGHVDLRRRALVAAVQLGEAVDPGGVQARAVAVAGRGLDQETDPGWLARLQATSSILHSMAGDPDRCRALFLSAEQLLEGQDDRVACDVLPYAYMALGHVDDLDRRVAARDRLLEAALTEGDPVAEWEAAHLSFSIAIMQADGPSLRNAHAEAQRLLPFAGNVGRTWSVAYQAAALAAIDGDLATAEARNTEAFDVGLTVAATRAMSAWSGQLFALRWQQSRLGELAALIRQIVEDQPEIPAWKAAGSLIVAAEDPELAGAWFDALVTDDGTVSGLHRDFAWLAGVLSLGASAAALEDQARAARVLPALAPYTHLVCWQGTCSYGPVAAVAADLAELTGDHEQATTWREDAERLRSRLRSSA